MFKRLPPGWLVILLLVLAIGLWSWMIFGSLAKISEWAGGLTPFDLRAAGYSLEEAIAFMAALGDGGRNYYVNFQMKLFDTPFIAINALAQMTALWWLTRPGRTSDRGASLEGRVALLPLPLSGAWFDFLENSYLELVLRAGADVTADIVAMAATMTVLKSALQTVISVLIVTFALLAFGRWLRSRRAARATG